MHAACSLRAGLSRFFRQPDPNRGMIAGARLAAHPAVDAGGFQSGQQVRAEEKVIDPQAGVSRPSIPEVIPEGVDRLVRVKMTDGVDPALTQELAIGGAAFWLHQGIVIV